MILYTEGDLKKMIGVLAALFTVLLVFGCWMWFSIYVLPHLPNPQLLVATCNLDGNYL